MLSSKTVVQSPIPENILGTYVHAVTINHAADLLESWAHQAKPGYICPATVYLVMTAFRNSEYRAIVNDAILTIPDGMPLVWFLKARRHQPTRVHGPNLMLNVCERSPANGLRHYLLGGAEGQAEEVALALQEQIPGIDIAGCTSTPIDKWASDQDEAVIKEIGASGANIVWAGMGTPWQDHWAYIHAARISAPVVGIGSAFDFISGRVSWAPRWIQQTGFQWLYRLIKEPRRLWRRYLWNNPYFVILSVLQLAGIKRFRD
jgi:N-acetylglucosaminyldiphosphoundecaprenol N-acetyl-beta-D-mannosaminyltransferase